MAALPRITKHTVCIALLALSAVSLLVGLIFFGYSSENSLAAPKGDITITRADSEEERRSGLSGVESLPADSGLLFEFEVASRENCFWMKDMRFAIDMIWLDASRRVISVYETVDPNTYPAVFCPQGDAMYGLEIAAGTARLLGIVEGVVLKFK